MESGADPSPISRSDSPGPAFRWPLFRFTTRHLMIGVAAAGLSLWLLRGCARFIEELEEPYPARSTTSQSFVLGPDPHVAVDCFAGTIEVRGSRNGETTVEVTRFAMGDTQSDAEEALGAIDVEFNHQGDTLRVAAREGPGIGYSRSASVTLHVPAGAHLDLRTGGGIIAVGPDYRGTTYAPETVVVRSVRARNDSLSHLGNRTTVNARGPTSPGHDRPDPIRLQVDGCGMIAIRAERATVEARSWHSRPPHGWTKDQYEEHGALFDEQLEGVLTFVGTLAEGDSHLRASHRVSIKLGGSPAVRIDAVAHEGPTRKGSITGEALDSPIRHSGAEARWAGTLGSGTGGTLTVQVDDGSIVLDSKP